MCPVLKCILPLIVFSVLISCSPSNSLDLKQYVVTIRNKPSSPIEPIPSFNPLHAYQYRRSQDRDPFLPVAINHSGDAKSSCHFVEHKREFLENYALDSLSMVGSVKKDQHRWALVRTPDGDITRVSVSNFIGENNGRIIKVTENSIELLEQISKIGDDCRETTTILTVK